MEEKLDKILEGQAMLQNSFNTMSHKMEQLENNLNKLDDKVINIDNKHTSRQTELELKRKEIELSMQFMSKQYDEYQTKNELLQNNVHSLQKLNNELFSKLAYVESKAEEGCINSDSSENQGRKIMVEIEGIPKCNEEMNDQNWCHRKVEKICEILDMPDLKSEIDVAHRLFNDRIIVAFKNRSSRNNFYYARFNLKGKSVEDLGLTKPSGKKGIIWINESLTGTRKRLLSKTKGDLTSAGFHVGKDGVGLYTSLGNVKVKSNGQIFNIACEKDIQKSTHLIRNASRNDNM